ncbi:MAG: site-2 protease family protein [Phycisphaerae bacterium]
MAAADPTAMISFTPMLVAVLLAWILCVCVHEFAHALVAYIGGDASVKARGYLSLDPTRFIDPVFSLLIPAIILLMGGLPLPGGSVLIDESALKSRRWGIYVAAAGPASNFILFLLFGMVLHPALGLAGRLSESWIHFCGAMAFLNFFATFFNLIPVPPLDGYRMIEHQFPTEIQWKMRQPQNAMGAFALLFLVFWVFPRQAFIPFIVMLDAVAGALGLNPDFLLASYGSVF